MINGDEEAGEGEVIGEVAVVSVMVISVPC
jgi:hypothetical protein